MARARTLTLKTKVEVTGADKLNSLGKKMQTTGRNLTVGLTLPLVALGGALVGLAEKQERAEAKLRASFDSMGAAAWTSVDALKAQASALQDVTTFGDEEILELQAVLLTFGNVAGESFDRATAAALDMSALLGQDLQSSAVQLGKALNDPIAGITALSRVGVSFTKEQKEQIKVLTESGDVMAAQGLILDELDRQFGNAAENLAGTTGGQMKQALNAIGDAGEEFGAIIAPVLRDVANGLKDFAKWLKELNPETKEWVVRIAAMAAALGPLLIVVGSIARGFGALKGASAAVIALAPKIGLAFTLMTGPISAAVAAVGALAAAFATDFLGVRSRFERDMADIGNILGDAGDAVRDFFGIVEDEAPRAARIYSDAQIEMLNSTEGAWTSMHSMYDQNMGEIVGIVGVGVDAMAEEMGEAPGKMADELLAAQFRLTDATSQLVAFMEQAISPAQEMMELQGFLASNELANGLADGNALIRQKSAEMRDAALSRLAELQGAAYTYGNNVGTSFAAGMNAAYGWVRTAAGNLAAATRNQIGINSEPKDPRSPLHGITKWGVNIGRTLAAGMDASVGTVSGAAARMAGAVAQPTAISAAVPVGGGSRGMVVNNFYLQWDGEAPHGRSEAEIVANLQRLSPLIGGKLAAGY